MHKRAALALFSVYLLALPGAPSMADTADSSLVSDAGDVLSVMNAANVDLKAMWMDIRLEAVEFYTIGQGRPAARVHQQPFRWVANDPRRQAEGSGVSYLVDGSWGGETGSGVPAGALAAAVRRAAATWSADSCMRDHPIHEVAWDGSDVTVTDFFTGSGAFGNPFAADVVIGGWLSDGPMFDSSTLAMSATYVFVHRDSGMPTDLDGDGQMDVALNEIYFNDAFDWRINASAEAMDVETAALHELGHALALGHFGPPPMAVMNPVYNGARHRLESIDHAGLCAVWSRRSR